MIQYTLIARISDGLPLCSSVNEEDGLGEVKRQLKLLSKRFMTTSIPPKLPPMASISIFDDNLQEQRQQNLIIHYIVDQPSALVFIAVCDRTFARLLAFAYLQDLKKSFSISIAQEQLQQVQLQQQQQDPTSSEHIRIGAIVLSVERPYHFIKYETEIGKAMRRFMNTKTLRTQDNLAELSLHLQSVPFLKFSEAVPEYNYSIISGSVAGSTVLEVGKSGLRKSASNNMLFPSTITAADGSSLTGQSVLMSNANSRAAQALASLVIPLLLSVLTEKRLNLLIVILWSYIAFWNLAYDLGYGLGKVDFSISKDHHLHLSDPKNPEMQLGGAPTDNLKECSAHVGYSLMPVAYIFGSCGFWLAFQLVRYVKRIRIFPNVLLENIFCPSPSFNWKLLIFMHVILTSLFLSQCYYVKLNTGFDYFEMRHSGRDLMYPAKDESLPHSWFFRPIILPYYLYILIFSLSTIISWLNGCANDDDLVKSTVGKSA